jgi:hypothetical protein
MNEVLERGSCLALDCFRLVGCHGMGQQGRGAAARQEA